MKNIIIKLVLLIIIFTGISIKATSQIPNNCPDGFTMIEAQIPVTENGNTCMYQVFLCTKCQAGTYPGSILTEIMVHAMRPIDENCQCNPDVVMNAIVDKINDVNWLAQFISNCGNGWPPCSGNPANYIRIEYYYPKCWKWEYFFYNEEPPYEYDIFKVAGCDCFCRWTKTFCWDGSRLIEIIELATPPERTGTCECLQPEYNGECWSEDSVCQ
jgi:hypothetical protein